MWPDFDWYYKLIVHRQHAEQRAEALRVEFAREAEIADLNALWARRD